MWSKQNNYKHNICLNRQIYKISVDFNYKKIKEEMWCSFDHNLIPHSLVKSKPNLGGGKSLKVHHEGKRSHPHVTPPRHTFNTHTHTPGRTSQNRIHLFNIVFLFKIRYYTHIKVHITWDINVIRLSENNETHDGIKEDIAWLLVVLLHVMKFNGHGRDFNFRTIIHPQSLCIISNCHESEEWKRINDCVSR